MHAHSFGEGRGTRREGLVGEGLEEGRREEEEILAFLEEIEDPSFKPIASLDLPIEAFEWLIEEVVNELPED